MSSILRKLQMFLVGTALGASVGYLQGSAVINIVRILGDGPVGGFIGQASAHLNTALVAYGIWAYVGASALKGLLLFVVIPAESVTPLYVLHAAETPFHVAGIVLIGAATITAANFVIYLLSRFAGERFVSERDTRLWRFVEWMVVEHGRLSMYFLRIIPWVGAWAAIPAGLAKLDARTFLFYSFLGFLTYEAALGYLAFYGLKAGTASIPYLSALPG